MNVILPIGNNLLNYKIVILTEDIRFYFGENIALYFIFLGYYTCALVPPMILGLIEALIPHTTTVFFCIFNVLWVTLFLEVINILLKV